MSVDSPQPRNIGQEMNDTLASQVNLAPQLFDAYQTYSPLYTAQSVNNLQTSLLGSQPSTTTTTQYKPRQVYRNKRTGAISDTMPTPPAPTETGNRNMSGRNLDHIAGLPREGASAYNPQDWEMITLQDPYQATRQVPGQRGMLDIYEKDILPTLTRAQNQATLKQRTADIRDVEQLGFRATEAFRKANPQQASLLDKINLQAQQGLDAGSQLSPQETHRITQQVRGDWANRGLGTSDPALLAESMNLYGAGQAVQNQRQQFGLQAAEMNKATSVDPFLAVLGRPSSAVNTAGGIANQGQSLISGVPNLDPTNPYASDVWDSNFNADAAAKIAEGNANAAVCAAGIQAAGSAVGGGLAGRGGGCWVAREVYGEDNPKWREFRAWLFSAAPAWFRWTYLTFGERFARFIKDKPRTKNVIRGWMDARVASHEQQLKGGLCAV